MEEGEYIYKHINKFNYLILSLKNIYVNVDDKD